jgi:thioredoxin-related protein
MKKILFSLVTLLSFGALLAQNGADEKGIRFFHGTYAEALEKAKAENKIVFMDAFTEWCGPCKRMAATTFKDEKVGKFFNENFVNLKMDMEKGEGVDLSRKFDVTAYPTLVFINEKGEVVQKAVGALQAEQLIASGRGALAKFDKTKDYEKDYLAGKREPELILNYIRALNRAGKSSLKVVNDYLLKADMSQAITQKIIYEGATQADSKVFDLLIAHKAAITTLFSEQLVALKIQDAIEKTAENALVFKSPDLHKEAKNKMKTYAPDKAEAFALEVDMKFYAATNDPKNFAKACAIYVKKEAKSDARRLFNTAKKMVEAFPSEKSVLEDAAKYLKTAAENGGMADYHFLYAQTLHKLGKKSDAISAAEKAIQAAKESAMHLIPMVQNFIEQIKQEG